MRQVIYRVLLDAERGMLGTLGDLETFVNEATSFDIDPDTPVTSEPASTREFLTGRLMVERTEIIDQGTEHES